MSVNLQFTGEIAKRLPVWLIIAVVVGFLLLEFTLAAYIIDLIIKGIEHR